MLIQVMRFKGRQPDTAVQARFTQAGGTIGRSSQCTLALPDPERHISRIQAEVTWTDGSFFLTDRGNGNPTMHNGQEVGKGHCVPLADGDELHCGDYVLRVEASPSRRASSSTASPSFDPFADLVPVTSDSLPMAGDHPLAPRAQADSLIPEDFDPFGRSYLVPGTPARSAPSSAGKPISREEDIDALFGLCEPMSDPLSIGRALGASASQPNTSSCTDPFASLQSPSRPTGPAIPDQLPEIHGTMPLPQAQTLLNPSLGSGKANGFGMPGIVNGEEGIGAFSRNGPSSAGTNDLLSSGLGNSSCRSSESVSGAEQLNRDALFAALLEGAGLREAPRDLLTGKELEMDEATMRRIGMLLRLFSQGVIDLLAARTTLKREMHAAVTVIASQNNNPLKFSPEAASALAYLLAPSTPRGFMTPQDAVSDAIGDLRAHQIGVMTGMRAALEGVLERFHPDKLETRLTTQSRFGGIMPLNRKARLWEQFAALFGEVSQEAEDHFDALFSDAFVRSYEEQIEALRERRPHQTKR